VLRTVGAGGPAADELSDLLGKPLDAAERDKALAIVRSGIGIDGAVAAARRFVDEAGAACDDFGSSAVVDALRAAPGALLATVA
jgi:hypothetical protein